MERSPGPLHVWNLPVHDTVLPHLLFQAHQVLARKAEGKGYSRRANKPSQPRERVTMPRASFCFGSTFLAARFQSLTPP